MEYRVWLKGPDKLIHVDVKSDTPPTKSGIPGEEANQSAIAFGDACWFRRSEIVAIIPENQVA